MYSNALLLVTHNLASNAAFSAAAFSASGPRGMGPYLALSSSLKVSERGSSSELLLILDGKVPRKPDLHPPESPASSLLVVSFPRLSSSTQSITKIGRMWTKT